MPIRPWATLQHMQLTPSAPSTTLTSSSALTHSFKHTHFLAVLHTPPATGHLHLLIFLAMCSSPHCYTALVGLCPSPTLAEKPLLTTLSAIVAHTPPLTVPLSPLISPYTIWHIIYLCVCLMFISPTWVQNSLFAHCFFPRFYSNSWQIEIVNNHLFNE